MARIRVTYQTGRCTGYRHNQWLEVEDAETLRRKLTELLLLRGAERDDARWKVLAYDGLPDFGPHPNLDELLAWLDAVDEFGPPFEAWWAMRSFSRVVEAADAFADRYQGTYSDRGSWARHTLGLMGARIGDQTELDAYAQAALVNGEMQFVDAVGGGIYVFWND